MPLAEALDRLVREIESEAPDLTASVLLAVNGHLRLGAAPHLPEGYNQAADNVPIGEGFGSCGTAAHRGQLVIAEDLQVDPLWKNYREIAHRYQLGACWSLPIKNGSGAVLGTFALYSRQPRRPHDYELRLVRRFADAAALTIERHRADQALAESEQRFRELIESQEAMVWQRSEGERRFTHVSASAEQLLGYPAARWNVPGFWASVLHPEDRQATLRREQAPIGEEASYQTEYRVRSADGRSVWIRDSVTVALDRPSGAWQARGTMINVSRQREAEEAREAALLQLAADRDPGPALRPARAPAAAPAAAQEQILIDAGTTLGQSLEPEVIAQSLADLVTRTLADWSLVFIGNDEGKLRCAALAHRQPGKGALRAEFERLLPQPGGLPFQVGALMDANQARGRLFPELPDDAFPVGAVRAEVMQLVRNLGGRSALAVPLPARTRVFGALVCVSSAPDRHYGERELALAEDLGRRAALALDNARLLREAHTAIHRREEFLSIAAHELKTPLASLQLTVQTILMAIEQQPADLAFIRGRGLAGERQVARLGRLINELLDVSRIRAGRLELNRTEMDLVAAVHLVVGRFREEITRKGIDITIHAPTPARGHWDQTGIEQIVSNLLSNAIKYGENKPVHLAIEQDAERVTLQVSDNGIGIDPQVIPRLFTPFERGVSAGQYGGLGLGLYIAGQNAQAHGGRISVRSLPGEGSTFTVELPRRVAGQALEPVAIARNM